MKNLLKKIIVSLLKARAKSLLKQSGAVVYGITGSVGKTTAKEALKKVLETRYRVIASEGGFNTSIGLLLSLLGEKESGFTNPAKWLQILLRIYTKKIPLPDRFVLEFGVDKKGDMDELLAIIQPDIAIITKIAPVHLAEGQFNSLEQIAQEKGRLAQNAKYVVLNKDCQYSRQIKTKAEKLYFEGASARNEENGFSFDYQGEHYFVPMFGAFQYSSFLPAVILGREEGITVKEIQTVLKKFTPPAGRGRIFAGLNKSTIWDSSYNASPEAVGRMLETLPKIPAKRRLALLGNMNELGEKSAEYHEDIGQKAAIYADHIFFVGENAPAFSKGVAGRRPLRIFSDAQEAGKEIKKILQKGDLLLVKGSQNKVRLERAIEPLLAHREDLKNLCRRGESWQS